MNESQLKQKELISKVIHLALVTNVPNVIIDQINKIQKSFIWNQKYVKKRHFNLYNTYKNGGIKSVDIPNKLTRLQCSWIRRLYNTTKHSWKIIHVFLITKN